MTRRIWLGSIAVIVSLGVLVPSVPMLIAQSARETACEAHREAKRYLEQQKFLDQAGGNPRQAAILICTGKYGKALDPKCIEWEEKILRQQIQQVESAIAKDCR